MIIVYSDKPIKGVGGMYISPRFFDSKKLEKAEVVYTDKPEIKQAYEAKGVATKGFPKAPQQPKPEAPKEATS